MGKLKGGAKKAKAGKAVKLKGAGKKAKGGRGAAVKRATWEAVKGAGAFGIDVGGVAGIGKAAVGRGGMPGRRKRISPTNVKALRRAASRLSKFTRLSSRVNRMLRKFAPKGSRGARRVRRFSRRY